MRATTYLSGYLIRPIGDVIEIICISFTELGGKVPYWFLYGLGHYVADKEDMFHTKLSNFVKDRSQASNNESPMFPMDKSHASSNASPTFHTKLNKFVKGKSHASGNASPRFHTKLSNFVKGGRRADGNASPSTECIGVEVLGPR